MLANITDATGAWIAPPGRRWCRRATSSTAATTRRRCSSCSPRWSLGGGGGHRRVLRLLGNHCVMNLVARHALRFARARRRSAARRRARARSRRTARSARGCSAPRCAPIVDGTLFVHAGLHPKWARLGCDGINRRAAPTRASRARCRAPAVDRSARLRRCSRPPTARCGGVVSPRATRPRRARCSMSRCRTSRRRGWWWATRSRSAGGCGCAAAGGSSSPTSACRAPTTRRFPFGVRDASRAAALADWRRRARSLRAALAPASRRTEVARSEAWCGAAGDNAIEL